MKFMRRNHSARVPCGLVSRMILLLLAASFFHASGHGQTTIGIRLTPTVAINGPVGSWQQIQYSDELSNPTNWTPLTNLLLSQSPMNYTDTGSGSFHRFYRSVTLTNVADTNLVWIPPGTFLMGSPDSEVGRSTNEGPQTQVTFTHGFFMGKFEVTQVQFVSVIGAYPIHFSGGSKSNNLAMDSVEWEEAAGYCDLLTTRDLAAFRIPPGWAYRLPSEAEWEYACRAGTTTVFAFGNALYNDTASGSLACFDGRQPYPPTGTSDLAGIHVGEPNVVGSYLPNGFGLYDMHGNENEWCSDSCISAPAPYPGGSITNPVPAQTGATFHILRGGSFFDVGTACRSAQRIASGSGAPYQHGFRVVLAPTN